MPQFENPSQRCPCPRTAIVTGRPLHAQKSRVHTWHRQISRQVPSRKYRWHEAPCTILVTTTYGLCGKKRRRQPKRERGNTARHTLYGHRRSYASGYNALMPLGHFFSERAIAWERRWNSTGFHVLLISRTGSHAADAYEH